MICNDTGFADCRSRLRAIQDTLDLLGGKWKVTLMAILGFGPRRFTDLQKGIQGIGPKMLTKELQELEMNGLVQRTEQDKKVIYTITAYGETLEPLIREMALWGRGHRERIMQGS